MARKNYRWVRCKALTRDEKAATTAACERLIAGTLKPRYLSEIRPNRFHEPINIDGRWRSSRYTFLVRFRSGSPDDPGKTFDAPSPRSTMWKRFSMQRAST